MKRLLFLLALAGTLDAQNTAKFPGAVPSTADLGVARNRAETTLATGINATATSIPVASSSGFAAGSFVTIDNEILAVCSIPDGNHLNVGVSACPNVDGRGTDTANGGGAAASHLAGAKVQARIVAWNQNQVAAEIIALGTEMARETFNVRLYGAKGDCTTDDTAAIRSAVTALNAWGKPASLYFPQGCYLVNPNSGYVSGLTGYLAQITNDYTTITGPGATVKLAGGHNYVSELGVGAGQVFYWVYFQVAADHCAMTDIAIDSNGMAVATGASGQFWATGARFIQKSGANAKGNSVTNAKFYQLGGWPVFGEYQTDFVIANNYATGSEGFVAANGTDGFVIANNISRDAHDAHFAANGSTTDIVKRGQIVGNVGIGNDNGSGIDVTGAESVTVSGNTLANNQNWCILVDKTSGPYAHNAGDKPAKYITVTGNTCRDNNIYIGFGNDAEIEVGDNDNTATPGQYAEYVTVSGNTIHTINPRGIGVETGYGAKYVNIEGNTISGCGWSGFPCQYPGNTVAPILDRNGDQIKIANNYGDPAYPNVLDINSLAGTFYLWGNANMTTNNVHGVPTPAMRAENLDAAGLTLSGAGNAAAWGTKGLLAAHGGGEPHWRIYNGTADDAHLRWVWGPCNTEAGSNVGADLCLFRYSNTGVYIAEHLKFQRSDGKTYFDGTVDMPNLVVGGIKAGGLDGITLTCGGSQVVTGAVYISGVLTAGTCTTITIP